MTKAVFRFFAAVILVTTLSALTAHSRPMDHIRVLALVSGHAITNRQVYLDTVIERPESFEGAAYRAEASVNAALERVITQYTVLEESRLLGTEKISDQRLTEELFRLKKALGPANWSALLVEFDVRETDVRKLIEDKLLVQGAIETRVKAIGALPEGQNRAQAVQEVVQGWLKQLRTRHRVSRMRYGAGTK